jgi:hypothetical protein
VPGSARASASWITWALAACFVALAGRAITHSRLLWGETTFEHTPDLARVAFAQTYQAARAIYDPVAPQPIALLGNSRIWLGAPAPLVNAALATRRPGSPAAVNLGIFGAGLGDLEALSRHLVRVRPSLTVVTLGTSDLLGTTSTPLAGVPARLLRIGWDGRPLGDAGPGERLDRWLRTLWPLYRFREFARAAIDDRIVPVNDPSPFSLRASAPDFHLASTRDLFDTAYGARGAAIEAAYARWRARSSLASFVAYVEVLNPSHLELVRQRARESVPVDPEGMAARLLHATLARLRHAGPTVVVLMPENPILREDVQGEFHRPGYSDEAEGEILAVARAHQVPLVDARLWMPARAFLDFDHLLPDLSGFHERLAEEVVHALDH